MMCKIVPERKCLRVGEILAFQICSTILTFWIVWVWNGRPSFIPLDLLWLVSFCSDFCHHSTCKRWFPQKALHTTVQGLTCPVSQGWVYLGLSGRVEAACWVFSVQERIRWRTAWCRIWNVGLFLRTTVTLLPISASQARVHLCPILCACTFIRQRQGWWRWREWWRWVKWAAIFPYSVQLQHWERFRYKWEQGMGRYREKWHDV